MNRLKFIFLAAGFCFNLISNNYKATAQTYFETYFNGIAGSVGKTSLNLISPYNPASLSSLSELQLVIGFAPARFGLKELSPASLSVAYPISENLKSSISLSGITNKLFTEFSGKLNAAYIISPMFSCGLAAEMLNMSVTNYGSQYAFRLNAGGILNLSESISAGFAFKNVTRSYYDGADKTALMSALFGFGIIATDNLFFDLDASITFNHSSGLAIAGMYELDELISIRTAYNTSPRSFDAGLKINAIQFLDLLGQFYYHDELGYNFSGGIIVYF